MLTALTNVFHTKTLRTARSMNQGLLSMPILMFFSPYISGFLRSARRLSRTPGVRRTIEVRQSERNLE
jgi:hypothetical protein